MYDLFLINAFDMLQILFLLSFVCMWFDSANSTNIWQNMDSKEMEESYICMKSKEPSNGDFVVSNYMLYNQNVDKENFDSTQIPLLTYKLIEYNQNAVGGKHALLTINNNDTILWDKNKHYIDYAFSCIAKEKINNNLSMIEMKVPIDLSLSISYGIREKVKQKTSRKYDGWKNDNLESVTFMEERLGFSYLYEDMSSILKQYNLRIRDFHITEPILSYSRKRFIQVYPQYSKARLPREIIGLYVIFYVETVSCKNE